MGKRRFKVVLNGKEYQVEVESLEKEPLNDVMPTPESIGLPIVIGESEFKPVVEEEALESVGAVKPMGLTLTPRAAVEVEGVPIKAPMPGVITKVLVKPGDRVKVKDGLIILEAMKMENPIESPVEGTVKVVNVKPGQSVQKDQVLVVVG
ncbi:MAG: biotin/lipoyl-containing protein [Candidatus Nezhaarchaeales archaeon]